MVIYLEVHIQAVRVHEAEVDAVAAHTAQLAGCGGAEGCVVDRSRHPNTGEQLEGLGAPQSHFWVRKVPYVFGKTQWYTFLLFTLSWKR